jgi:hypothetical protein
MFAQNIFVLTLVAHQHGVVRQVIILILTIWSASTSATQTCAIILKKLPENSVSSVKNQIVFYAQVRRIAANVKTIYSI